MEHYDSYQDQHLKAIKGFYSDLNQKTSGQVSLTEVVIAWFTEGYAESYRRKHLKHRTAMAS